MTRARELANFADNTAGLETLTVSDITDLTATATELNKLDGVTATTSELNVTDGVTVSTANINSAVNQITDSSTDLNVDSNTLVVDKSENRVGIGTVNTVAPLTVQSNSGAEAVKILGRSADDIGQMLFLEADGTTRLGRIDARTAYLDVASDNALYLSAGGVGTQSVTINSTGNVGIGTTPASNQKLYVSGNTQIDGNLVLEGNDKTISPGNSGAGYMKIHGGGTNNGGAIEFRGGGNSGDLRFLTGTSGVGTERIRILSNGNVGIGGVGSFKSDPQDELHIVGTARISEDNTNSHVTNAKTALEVRGPSIPSGSTDLTYFKGFKIALNDASEWGGQAQFSVGRWEENGADARSTLVISLGHGALNSSTNADVDVLRLYSSGTVQSHGSITAGSVIGGDIDKNAQFTSYDYINGSTGQRTALHRSMQNVSGSGTGGAYWDIRSSQNSYNTAMHFWLYRQWSVEEEFRFQYTGTAYAENAWSTGSLDFAELFEWADGNPDNEDRIGLPVVNVGGKIRVATNEDDPADIIGCISGVAGFIGNSASLHWKDKFITDDYGRVVEEDAHAFIWKDDKGEEHQYAYDEIPEGITVPEDAERVEGKRKKVNPDFDPSIEYIPREKRKEWGTVGLIGQVPVKNGAPVNPNWIKLKECSTQSDWYLVR